VCLLILARYFGLPADADQLRHQFGETGQPLGEADLLRAAKHLGLKAGVVPSDWARLSTTPMPAIALLKDGRAVVLAKADAEQVVIQDPRDSRLVTLPRRTFEEGWSGRLLLLTKRAGLGPGDRAFDFTWFIPAIVKYRKLLGEVLLASFVLQLFALLTPLFTQVVIDKVLVHKGLTTLHVLAIGMVTLILFETTLGALRAYLFSHTSNRIDVGLGAQVFRHLVALPLACFEARQNYQALVSEFQQTHQAELTDATTKIASGTQEVIKAGRRTGYHTLTAPIDGVVQQLAVHTVGGVVTPAQELMVVVPREDQLDVEAWLENKDIGFVKEGQPVEIKVETFPFTLYGTIGGTVVSVSDDAVPLEKGGLVYAARVSMARSTLQVEGKQVHLAPGMAVTAEIKTGERRVIQFFLSPVLKGLRESARER
jgi:hypothetical protein